MGKAGAEGNQVARHGDPFALGTHEENNADKQRHQGPCAGKMKGLALFALRKIQPYWGGELHTDGNGGAGHAHREDYQGALPGKGDEQHKGLPAPVYLFGPEKGQQHQSRYASPKGGKQHGVHGYGL